jgi:tRNA threonylcarbamoyladenosine biosynthesis protein TsaB
MDLILSIETATPVCSVALHAQGKLISCQSLYMPKSHAESLLPMIAHVLELSPYTQKDLTTVAISQGPGSYTGLRIGTATAKGLCYALGIPLIAINTLEAMAYGVGLYGFTNALRCPMIDARRMELYYLLAHPSGHVLEETQAHVIDKHSFEAWLKKGLIVFFGDGAAKCKPIIGNHPNAIFLDHMLPCAEYIGALAHRRLQAGSFENLSMFEPFYLKPFQGKPIHQE